MAKHNRAAFSAADVGDAKRGRPDVDLRGYAAQRGLEFLDHMTIAGFRAAMPGEADWQHNVIHGTLPGGGYGVLLHEGLAIDWSRNNPAWSGPFHGVRVSTVGGRPVRDAILDLVPFGDALMSQPEYPPARVPCTVAAVRVPEARGVFPTLRIDRRRNAPPYDFGNRREVGEPGWEMQSEVEPPAPLVESLLAPPADDVLRSHAGDALFQMVGWYGILLARRNGYLSDPASLDELATAAGLFADRLRDACAPLAAPQPFEASLPAPGWTRGAAVEPSFKPIEPWPQWMLETAQRRGLALEDPQAYHRAFPRVPVPGVAHAVMRGSVPPFGDARLVVHFEEHSARPAVVVAAPDGFEATPPGGLRFSDRQARVEASDGLLAVWSTTSYYGSAMAGDLDEFLSRAASVAREACPAALA